MSNLENKEKNLNRLLDKLSNLSGTYSQSFNENKKIEEEKNQLKSEKKDIEHRHTKLMREHEYIKVKLLKIQAELKEKSDYEEKFNQDIEELSQETQSLVEEIDKWQT
tara:strand:- start:68 stop:391 length:324 start_codon:yes stop_codon:yes gene_type:complete